MNRLSANSLLDIVVFGRACSNTVAEISEPGQKQKPLAKDAGEKTITWLDKSRNSNGSLPTSRLDSTCNELCRIMLPAFVLKILLKKANTKWPGNKEKPKCYPA